MIKKVIVHNVRDINISFDCKEMNVIHGDNGSGKSTIIDLIKNMYKGSTTIKEGETSIIDDNDLILQNQGGKMLGSIGLKSDMDLMTPGFFVNNLSIAGVNKTAQDRRNTISEILGIDRDKFFEEHGVDYDITGIYAKIKSLETESDTYTKQLIEKENELKELHKVKKPKKVEYTAGNAQHIEMLKSYIESYNYKIEDIPKELPEPKEVELVQSTVTPGNGSEYKELVALIEDKVEIGKKKKAQIEELQDKNKEALCPTCGQELKDNKVIDSLNKELEELRKETFDLMQQKKNFVHIEDKRVDGNEEEYKKYLSDLEEYKNRKEKIKLVKEYNAEYREEIKKLKKELSETKLIEDNREECDIYLAKQREYEKYINTKEYLEKDIADLTNKIKSINVKELEDKIEKYKNTEEDFIKSIESKLKLSDDISFIFYRKLKSPNAKGENYAPTFEIEYKGKMYGECSKGEQAMIDILIAKTFINHFGTIDFLLIDNAELGTAKLKSILPLLSGYQLFVTRIKDGGKLSVSHTL